MWHAALTYTDTCGCPLKRAYINRHNKVGRLVMTRLVRGRKGTFVIQMDLGSTENCAEDGIMAHQSRNIPWELFPGRLKEAVQQAQGTTNERPNGLLYKPRNGNKSVEYWIIEVKICRHSDPTGQQSKADYQHQVLIDKSKTKTPLPKYGTILCLSELQAPYIAVPPCIPKPLVSKGKL